MCGHTACAGVLSKCAVTHCLLSYTALSDLDIKVGESVALTTTVLVALVLEAPHIQETFPDN